MAAVLLQINTEFLWWLIGVVVCLAGMIFVGTWAWLHYLKTSRRPDLLEDIPGEERSPISQFPKTRYEHKDADIGGVLLFVLALAIGGILVHLLVYQVWLHGHNRALQQNRQLYPAIHAARRNPPSPQLQWDPTADLNYMREEEQRLLNSYGWADQKAGTVRIPIGLAIRLTAQRGLPARQVPYAEQSDALLNQAAASGPLQPGQALKPSAPTEQPHLVPDRTYQIQESQKSNE
jgi:hypothetical protein